MLETEQSDILARAEDVLVGGVNSPVRAFKGVDLPPLVVAKSQGAFLYDLSGKQYIDYVLGWGPLVLGHAHPDVCRVVSEQILRGSTYGLLSSSEVLLAEKIRSMMPNLEKIRFVSTGTEAAMTAVRLARAYTKRSKIVKFTGCYHGHVDSLLVKAGSGVLTLALPDSAGVASSAISDTITLPYNNLAAVTELFKRESEGIAGIILEPVVGNSGFIAPVAGFLEGLRELCTKHGSILIFDEVMTGFRVALDGAQGLFNVRPDLTMLAKVVGGGFPVGAVGGRREIMDLLAPIGPVYQAGTFSGNPVGMIAGLTALELWTTEQFHRVSTLTKQLLSGIKELATQRNLPCWTDSRGTMGGYFFTEIPVTDLACAERADKNLFKKFYHGVLKAGIYLPQSPYESLFLSAAHSEDLISETLSKIELVFAQL